MRKGRGVGEGGEEGEGEGERGGEGAGVGPEKVHRFRPVQVPWWSSASWARACDASSIAHSPGMIRPSSGLMTLPSEKSLLGRVHLPSVFCPALLLLIPTLGLSLWGIASFLLQVSD